MKNTIYNMAIGKIYVPETEETVTVSPSAVALIASFLRILAKNGYTVSSQLFFALICLSERQMKDHLYDLFVLLKENAERESNGFLPLYRKFPETVMNADKALLELSAFIHYLSDGIYSIDLDALYATDYVVLPLEPVRDPMVLQLLLDDERKLRIHSMLRSPNAVTEDELEWMLQNMEEEDLRNALSFGPLPNHVNAMHVAKEYLFSPLVYSLVRTKTDLLRVACLSAGHEPELDQPVTRFNKLPRRMRERYMEILDQLMKKNKSTEDLRRYQGLWKKFGRVLHPGEYQCKYPMAFGAFQLLWENKLEKSFLGSVEEAFKQNDYEKVIKLLSFRPGEFSRSFVRILAAWPDKQENTVMAFNKVIAKIDTKKLLALYERVEKKGWDAIYFPMGGNRAPFVKCKRPTVLSLYIVKLLQSNILRELERRAGELPAMGKVYIDPMAKRMKVPGGQTTTASSRLILTRGNRLPIAEKANVIRGFIFWQNNAEDRIDLDLSATIYTKHLQVLDSVWYRNLRNEYCCHSGDIVSAPNGAAEYIDLNLEKLETAYCQNPNLDSDFVPRYVLFTINSFTKQKFSEISVCSAGWMERTALNSGEVWEPASVAHQFQVRCTSTQASTFAVDLETREIIWLDVPGGTSSAKSPDNVQTRQAAHMAALRSQLQLPDFTLYDLLALHARVRGELVDDPRKADVTFMENGTISLFDNVKIASEFLGV